VELTTQAFESASAFLEDVQSELGSHEVEHHLILGVAHGLASQQKDGALLLTLRDETGLAVAALLSPNRPLLVATNRSSVDDGIVSLARWLSERGHSPKGFIADLVHADVFAKEWQRLNRGAARIKVRQRLHVLRDVAPVARTRGNLRRAGRNDLDLLQRWVGAFNTEALRETLDPELRDAIVARADKGELFLWEDGEPRSMAASARPTPNGIAINSVYTPPEWRGRGYATTCVAALSEHLLNSGRRFCVLYTDLANPTSNAIYARIGYRAVSDSLLYEFGRGT
jgi:predicted GNAT family acetyltransferase